MKHSITALVCVATLLCAVAVWKFRGIPGVIKIQVSRQYQPVSTNRNPLFAALDAHIPDHAFEDLVTQNPGWMAQRDRQVGKRALEWSILSDCVIARKTNYAKILIRHGADVRECINFFTTNVPDPEALEFLAQVQTDLAAANEQ